MTDGQIFRNAMHAALVYRKVAAEQRHIAGRIFWLRSAIGAYQTARRARDRMRFV